MTAATRLSVFAGVIVTLIMLAASAALRIALSDGVLAQPPAVQSAATNTIVLIIPLFMSTSLVNQFVLHKQRVCTLVVDTAVLYDRESPST